jgi:hypothetical protein
MTRPKRFRDMSLTDGDAADMAQAHWRPDFSTAPDEAWDCFVDRCIRLLPLWRAWSVERERLWFALIGLGLDIEGDERDMPRAEMRQRIENGIETHQRRGYLGRANQMRFVLRELDR